MSIPFFLTVAYAGAGFHGWQVQSTLRSGQGVLWEALRRLDPEAPLPQGTGRTDAGVHARAQGVLIHVTRVWEPYRLLAALNAHLPHDIRVMEARPAAPGFFPRQHAVAKRYVYRLGFGPAADPLQAAFRWHIYQAMPLNLNAMALAIKPLLGTHDFSSFRCVECVAKTPIRSLHGIGLVDVEGGIDLVFEGSSFLMHQVRIMAGTLVDVGRGRRSPDSLAGLLQAKDRRLAGPTAPPHGLCLEKVWYEAKWGLGEISPFGART
ncbi:tRNA pseudouridine(38-40) synthase TruA [Geothrix sp. PMB-07]|uniref:tRNA pseudouridine(38-40) synthase TruA n=1 Tax=Geothrix sp. PMB-07 TaxID=3068640 RepID=UPI0027412F41|nr:tRNA pseudouridine(38-40) synthase TruA [Geothrix sp. PMB-07]WLT30234.1 tRNA pseudouridine(38-40) synthase TruA [Geothrix sp. PMB-07]